MKLNQKALVSIRRDHFNKTTEKLDQKVQESIFGVLYVLLKDDDSSHLLHLFLTFIEFVEFMIFPFHSAVISAWADNSNITQTIGDYAGYINIVNYIQNSSQVVFLSIFYLGVISVTLVIINIAYVSYSFSRKYFTITWPLHVLRNVAKTFVTILFMPLFGKINLIL